MAINLLLVPIQLFMVQFISTPLRELKNSRLLTIQSMKDSVRLLNSLVTISGLVQDIHLIQNSTRVKFTNTPAMFFRQLQKHSLHRLQKIRFYSMLLARQSRKQLSEKYSLVFLHSLVLQPTNNSLEIHQKRQFSSLQMVMLIQPEQEIRSEQVLHLYLVLLLVEKLQIMVIMEMIEILVHLVSSQSLVHH